MQHLTMLGTGSAAVTQCYNTCFTLSTNAEHLLIDAGGGNGILRQLELADIKLTQLKALFITHAHTDHILGCVWVLRLIAQSMKQGKFEGQFPIYAHDLSLQVLETICRQCLPANLLKFMGERIELIELKDGDNFEAAGFACQCFDVGSTKAKQFGFKARLETGAYLSCLGDEPFKEQNRQLIEGSEWLLSEAFCLFEEADRFKPYEKNHSTAADAGHLAARISGVEHLLLYHTEDKSLSTRRARYTAEAAQAFKGQIHVPDDLERIELAP